MSPRRRIRYLASCVALLLFMSTGALAQEAEEGHRPPVGSITLGVGAGTIQFLSALPAAYLDGISGRAVSRGHALDDRHARGLRLGVRLGSKWRVEGELVSVDTKFGAANLGADVDYRGVNAIYALPGAFYATAGAGEVSYSFRTVRLGDFPTENTDFAANVGLGGWMRSILGGPFTFRTELKLYVSRFDVPGLEPTTQHHLGGISGLEISFP